MTMTTQEITGVGRDILVERLRRLQEEHRALENKLAAAEREKKALTDNVTALQKQANHRLTLRRLDNALLAEPALADLLLDVAWGIRRARALHPEGCSVLTLMQEAGEVARALEREDAKRYRDELVDTAAVVCRLLLGEVDPRLSPREPFAARAQ